MLLDLGPGYWQVAMAEDKAKYCIVARFGLFEFTVMPFGLTNAHATFQGLMVKLLKGLQWKVLGLSLDDVVILENQLAPAKMSKFPSTLVMGYASFCIMAFNFSVVNTESTAPIFLLYY